MEGHVPLARTIHEDFPMRIVAIVVILLAIWPSLSEAGCDSPMTQGEMNRCAGLDLAKATDQINATYADLRRRIPEDKREELRQVQLAWISFKDRHCRLEARFAEGGSTEPMLRDMCLEAMTKQRDAELQKLVALLEE
jgi:uncharacterized protein YecT (DUF1311 family)